MNQRAELTASAAFLESCSPKEGDAGGVTFEVEQREEDPDDIWAEPKVTRMEVLLLNV